MKRCTRATIILSTVMALGWLAVGRSGHAAPGGAPARAAAPRTVEELAAELGRLSAEVREQRGLIMQLMRVEQEHYELMLRLVQGGARAESARLDAAPAPGAIPPSSASLLAAPDLAAPRRIVRTAGLRGKVVFGGGAIKDTYVYVENVKSAPVRGRTFEIAQRDKTFVPEVAVVQRGTRVLFPNYDSVFHNVFSPTVPHPFDLGSYRAGDAVKSVEMTSAGVVDVFCNMHSQMHASVLVVPSALYTRVSPDGSFALEGVPLGSRKVVVWGPRSKPAEQTVEVGAGGADLSFTLEPQPEVAHNNKLGQPYGSYKE